jgi:hypothetical protein
MGEIESKPTLGPEGPSKASTVSARVAHESVAPSQVDSVFASLKAPVGVLANIVLGERIAPGVYVTFSTGRARMHVARTDAPHTIESLRESVTKIPAFVERYRSLQGFTPSFSAFKLCALMMRMQMGTDRAGIRRIQDLCAEAKAVDLKRPVDRKWKREMKCEIGGVPTKLTVSLSRVPMFTRVVSRLMRTDLSREDRANRYGFKVSLKNDTKESFFSLTPARKLFRQAAEMSALMTPIAATLLVARPSVLAGLAANLSESPVIRGALVDGMGMGAVAIAGTLTYLVKTRALRALLAPSPKAAATYSETNRDESESRT